MKRKWIVYGATGAVGIAVLGGAAAAAASTMDLRTDAGTIAPGGAITGKDVLSTDRVALSVTASSVTVVTAASPVVFSVASAPTPAPAPGAPVVDDSVPSPLTPPTPPSPPSPATPASPASVASAWTD